MMNIQQMNFEGMTPRETANAMLEDLKRDYGHDITLLLSKINQTIMDLEKEIDDEYYAGRETEKTYEKVETVSVLANILDKHNYMDKNMEECEHEFEIIAEHGGSGSGTTVAKCYKCGKSANHVWY